MSTLIEVRTSDGVIGRCDAKCYDAQHARCECVCGGANHGQGREAAMRNTRDLAWEWAEAYAESKGFSDYEALVDCSLAQRDLFGV